MTKELFLKYEEIRKSGKYNMLMDAVDVMREMKLNPRHKSDLEMYSQIIKNYSEYAQRWIERKVK